MDENSVCAYREAIGKTIESVVLNDKCLIIHFFGELSLELRNSHQLLYERWFMYTDYDITQFKNSQLIEINEKIGSRIYHNSEQCEDTMFLEIVTTVGLFMIVADNFHNNEYYSGFDIEYILRGV